jgi:hypothetical protein
LPSHLTMSIVNPMITTWVVSVDIVYSTHRLGRQISASRLPIPL